MTRSSAAAAQKLIERDSPAPERDIEEWERRIEVAIDTSATIPETERTALIQARRGQGLFRDNVRSIERACRITRVERMEHLIASHIQPWRDSSQRATPRRRERPIADADSRSSVRQGLYFVREHGAADRLSGRY